MLGNFYHSPPAQDLNEKASAAWEELGRRNKNLLRYLNTKLGPTVCAAVGELKRYFATAQVSNGDLNTNEK